MLFLTDNWTTSKVFLESQKVASGSGSFILPARREAKSIGTATIKEKGWKECRQHLRGTHGPWVMGRDY